MPDWPSIWKRISRQLGSLKAAVILIFSLAAVLAVGTLCESYYSRAYAYNLVYGAPWFGLLLLFLAVNILVAALLRLPYQKRLAGFYLSHLGLLVLLAGSLVTLIWGVDGTLTLPPGQWNNLVRLDEPVLYAQIDGSGSFHQIVLPKTVFPKNLNSEFQLSGASLRLKRYIPYAKEQPYYEDTPGRNAAGLEFTLFAPQVSTKGVLSSPPSDYPETNTFGPLKTILLGTLPEACKLPTAAPRQRWMLLTPENCFFFDEPSAKGLELGPHLKISGLDLLQHNLSYRLETPDGPNLLIPAAAAWPLRESQAGNLPKSITPDFSKPYRLYAAAEMFSTPTLIFYTQKNALQMLVVDPQKNSFETREVKISTTQVLPWMKLRLSVDRTGLGLPRRHFVPTSPAPGDKEHLSAVAFETDGQLRWLASGMDLMRVTSGSHAVDAFLGFKTIQLPWTFSLERFKMDRDPGTQNPASFESFVNLRTPGFQNVENAHVYMNNPLKKGKYTLYQASYFQVSEGQYGSVLQVNFDPGRWPKYIGSLIIVAGTILHFYIRRTRRAQTST